MKISKVNHTRSAVSNTDSNPKGVLYQYPAKTNQTIDVNDQFNKLIRNAINLYNIFNRSDKYGSDVNKLNKALNIVFFDVKKNILEVDQIKSKIENSQKLELKEKTKKESEDKAGEDDRLEQILSSCLKKSLRNYSNELAVVINSLRKKQVDEEELDQAISTLREVLSKDIRRKTTKENIKKSIENQNLVVQPESIKDDSDKVFILSKSFKRESDSSRNNKEKKGLAAFLNQYATLDKKTRDQYLKKIRCIIDIYFSVPEKAANDSKNIVDVDIIEAIEKSELSERLKKISDNEINVWKDHVEAKGNNIYFVKLTDHIKEIISDSENQKDAASTHDENLSSVLDKRNNRTLSKDEVNFLRDDIRCINAASYRISTKIINKYADSGLFFDDGKINSYIIHHIENAVERILDGIGSYTLFKLRLGYLSEKVWKDILNLISIKYIAIGKAVYNFAVEDAFDDTKTEKNLGRISENVKNGISSFDYEIIKANETLQREVAVDVTFAANNFSRATVDIDYSIDKEEDFLLWKINQVKSNLKHTEDMNDEDLALTHVLQFFGGRSSWHALEDSYKNYKRQEKDVIFDYGTSLVYDIKNILYEMRNETFHFNTLNNNIGDWNRDLVSKMFSCEVDYFFDVEKNKMYSNNLPMFYNQDKLKGLIDFLYHKEVPRMAQVPSFNTVFVRKNFPDFLQNELHLKPKNILTDAETMLKWENALYYAFKQIYYHVFFDGANDKESDIKNMFIKTLSELNEYGDGVNKEAVSDFYERVIALKDKMSFAEICQNIMSEYNLQNSRDRRHKSSRDAIKNPDIFQHYKLLLNVVIQKAFAKFLNKEKSNTNSRIGFLLDNNIRVNDMMPVEKFCPNWRSGIFDSLKSQVSNDIELQKWYVFGRLLDGKIINQLIGSIRSYIQYEQDVRKRAENVGVKVIRYDKSTIEKFQQILKALEVCVNLSGKFSDDYTDYFSSKEEYAEYLSHFLKYENSKGQCWENLVKFCEGLDDAKIYLDAKNPINNRNIIMSKLYGPYEIIGNVLEANNGRITNDDLKEYSKHAKEIDEYRVRGKARNITEQRSINKFQRLKNRVELRNITEYGELINELLGQMVNWSYLRERDLLYFQLGFHYSCLQNDSSKPKGYKVIKSGNTEVKGAILYQILSMYINGISIFEVDKKGNFVQSEKSLSTGGQIRIFYKYCGFILDKKNDKEKYYDETIYNSGLEVFENINEHENIINLRNAIDHMKYYSLSKEKKDEKDCFTYRAYGILDYYSEIFDRFFTYDMRYKNNVPNMLKNILMRHFIVMYPVFDENGNKKAVGSQNTKNCASIGVQKNGFESDYFTYKFINQNNQQYEQIDTARDFDFLKIVLAILYYPHAISEGLIKNQDDFIKKQNDKFLKTAEKKQGNNSIHKQNQNKRSGYPYVATDSKQRKNDYKNNKSKGNHEDDNNCTTGLGSLLKGIKLDN